MASNAAHATDAGCNKCKKCEKSEKYEKCDNFVTSVKSVKIMKSMKSVTIRKFAESAVSATSTYIYIYTSILGRVPIIVYGGYGPRPASITDQFFAVLISRPSSCVRLESVQFAVHHTPKKHWFVQAWWGAFYIE